MPSPFKATTFQKAWKLFITLRTFHVQTIEVVAFAAD
jgi:hypothetical protein